MVLGKPVIVSEEAGSSAYVREAQCGYLVQPNPASICAGLVRAIETRDQWQSMGERGRTFAYEHLTWDKIAAQEVRSLEEVLGRARTTV
jgi:glycosyltransferase involved in cell wall biosynthesis